MDIVKLRELLEEELSKLELVRLDEDFYREYDSLIKALKLSAESSRERGEDVEERLYLAQLKIAEELMREILRLRLHKIVDLAVDGKLEDMTAEERKLYRVLRAFVRGEELPGEGVEEKAEEESEPTPAESPLRGPRYAYIVGKSLPAVMGPDLKEYGPFMAGDLVTLPEEIGSVLVRRGVAVKIRLPQ
ncbi:hypothetical protein [Thermococcus sp.]|uniref:DNA replication complex subunit Gins51 n=1 Tax=Thermococcus sp. TaxID=35749 RepID=UPI0026160D46|nr:hypothetical protein [Thermococcus sp.]